MPVEYCLVSARVARPPESASNKSTAASSFHNLAALLSLVIMGCIVLLRLVSYMLLDHPPPLGTSDWLALSSLIVLMIACIWDKHAKYAVAGVYLTGLLVAGTALDGFGLTASRMVWALVMVLAVYAITTSLLWRWREKIIGWAALLKIPRRIDAHAAPLQWLVAFNLLLVALVAGLAYFIDLEFPERTLRLTAALAVTMQALTFALLAPAERRQGWQRAAFGMFALGAVFFGWAWLVPGPTGTWLNRAVILMVEMFAIVALFGLELDKALEREPEWTRAIRDCVPWLTGAGIVALIFILCTEVFYQIEFGAVRINPLALVTIAVTLAAATVICVLFALSPKHDPLNLPEQQTPELRLCRRVNAGVVVHAHTPDDAVAVHRLLRTLLAGGRGGDCLCGDCGERTVASSWRAGARASNRAHGSFSAAAAGAWFLAD